MEYIGVSLKFEYLKKGKMKFTFDKKILIQVY
jgi:hypothetical protein